MQKLIIFFENSGFVVDGKVSRDLALLSLTEKQIDWLTGLKIEVGGCSQAVLRVGRKEIKASNLVGFFSGEEISIQVLPKIYSREVPDEFYAKSALSNLIFMLKKSWEIEIWTDAEAEQASFPDSLIDAIVWVFANRLRTYLRLGIKKNYTQITAESAHIRGQMKFVGAFFEPRSIVQPTCSWDDWTDDTPVNRSLLGLTELLRSRVVSPKLAEALHALGSRLRTTVGHSQNFQPLLAEIPATRDQNYVGLIKLAKILAKNIHPSMSGGRQENICIGFDMNHLFETYVYSLLFRYKRPLGLKFVDYQTGKRLISHFYEVSDSSFQQAKLKNTFTDIILIDENDRKFILDAKYKVVESESKSLGISNADIYQLTTYQRLHKVADNDIFGILVFPKSAGDLARFFKLNTLDETWFGCHSIDLMCDLASSEGLLIETFKETLLTAIKLKMKEGQSEF